MKKDKKEKKNEKEAADSDIELEEEDDIDLSQDDDVSSKASCYPKIDFEFAPEMTFVANPIAIDEDRMTYLRIKAKFPDGSSKLTPFVILRESTKKSLFEVTGYTTDLVNSSIQESSFVKKFHPLMDELKERLGEKKYRINPEIQE